MEIFFKVFLSFISLDEKVQLVISMTSDETIFNFSSDGELKRQKRRKLPLDIGLVTGLVLNKIKRSIEAILDILIDKK